MGRTATPKNKLYDHCLAFINEHRIHSGEVVYQSDRVIENAYDFIDGVCKIVGYANLDDEEIDE